MNPTNMLPTDPEWVKKLDAEVKRVADVLGCAVVLIAAQDGGKLAVVSGGKPEAGPLAELLSDAPSFFYTLGRACQLSEAFESLQQRN